MKKLLLITTALLLTSFTYAGEGDEKKSCESDKKCCACETCEGTKPEGKCCCAEEKPAETPAAETPAPEAK